MIFLRSPGSPTEWHGEPKLVLMAPVSRIDLGRTAVADDPPLNDVLRRSTHVFHDTDREELTIEHLGDVAGAEHAARLRVQHFHQVPFLKMISSRVL